MNLTRRTFGEGGQVSLFTLGTMRALDSQESMYCVLKEACLAGINHIETAPSYGNAQSYLGQALKQLRYEGIEPEDGWIITSKILPGINLVEGKKQLKDTLKSLGLKRLSNLAIHGLNLYEHLTWALKGDGKKLLHWAQAQNLITQFGFTSHGSFPLIEDAIKSNQFNFCSLHLHLLDQERLPLAKLALSQGMGVMAISPADKGGHLHSPSETLIKHCFPIAPLELAYRFLLAEGISSLTVGANKTEDLALSKKLINAYGPLTNTELSAIKRLYSEGKRRLGDTYCGQCRKCLPCPQGVPIPEILRLRNLSIGHDLQSFSKERYNLIGKAGHWWEQLDASACSDCGDCLPRCPYHLKIPELLEETHRQLVDNPKRRLWG